MTKSGGPLIARELDILADLDVFPAIPEILVTYNADFTIIYDSPIDHLQQAHKAEGLQNTLLTLTPFINANPSILNIFDVYAIIQQLSEIYGMPQTMLKPKDLVV